MYGYLTPGVGFVGSGGITSGELGNAVVLSGNIGSGQIGTDHIADGTIIQVDIASGAVVSGNIASGQIGRFHIASGQLEGFELGSGAIVSGRIASGQIGVNHLSSGLASGTAALTSGSVARASQFVVSFLSGSAWSLNTEEMISGGRAVSISQSGYLKIAMASVSGRMPAVGFVFDNVLSGIAADVYTHGMFQLTSGMADYSGYVGKPTWVGRSGQIISWSGSFNSGGLLMTSGGDFVQRLGTIVNSGAFVANINPDVAQNILVGVTQITDVANRAFGV